MIYGDEKIECEKWRATITATFNTATIQGTIQTLMTASMVTVLPLIPSACSCHPTLPAPPIPPLNPPPPPSSSNGGLPLKKFKFLGPRIS